MAFSSLPQTTQDLIMVNFELFGKLFILGCIFYYVYINSQKEYEEKTPYLLIGYFRVLQKYVSKAILFILPLSILLLYPQVSLSIMIQYLAMFYTASIFIGSVLVLINILYFSPLALLKVAGFDADKEKTNELFNKFEKFSENFKFWKGLSLRR